MEPDVAAKVLLEEKRAKKVTVRLELHNNKLVVKDENGILENVDPYILQLLEEQMCRNLQMSGGNIDTTKANKLVDQVETFLETTSRCSVKSLRVGIPRSNLLMFHTDDVCAGRQKIKHLWSDKPQDWPDNIPFIDPNNSKAGRKLQQDDLKDIYQFLQTYWRQNRERIKRRIQEVGANTLVPPKENKEDWRVPLMMLEQTTLTLVDEISRLQSADRDRIQSLRCVVENLSKNVDQGQDARIRFSDAAHRVRQLMTRIRLREDLTPQDVDCCRKIYDEYSLVGDQKSEVSNYGASLHILDEFMKITYGVTPMDSPPGSQMSEITQKVQSASTSPGQTEIDALLNSLPEPHKDTRMETPTVTDQDSGSRHIADPSLHSMEQMCEAQVWAVLEEDKNNQSVPNQVTCGEGPGQPMDSTACDKGVTYWMAPELEPLPFDNLLQYFSTPMDSHPGSQMSEITQKVQSASTFPGQGPPTEMIIDQSQDNSLGTIPIPVTQMEG